MNVVPVYVFTPPSPKVPPPSLLSPFVPETTAFKVNVVRVLMDPEVKVRTDPRVLETV